MYDNIIISGTVESSTIKGDTARYVIDGQEYEDPFFALDQVLGGTIGRGAGAKVTVSCDRSYHTANGLSIHHVVKIENRPADKPYPRRHISGCDHPDTDNNGRCYACGGYDSGADAGRILAGEFDIEG